LRLLPEQLNIIFMKNFSFYLFLFLFPLVSFGANTHTGNLFSANSQAFYVADSASIRVDDGWTLSFWLRIPSTPPAVQNKIIMQRSGENGMGVAVTTGGFIRLFAGSGAFSNADSNVDHSDNLWHKYRITWNGGSTGLYVDDVLENTLNVPAITPPNTRLSIGCDIEGNNNPSGACSDLDIDDLRIYPSSYSGTNSSCRLTDETGLNAHWNLDNSLLDETANNNNLTNFNSATFQSTSLPYTDDCGSGGGDVSVTATTTPFNPEDFWQLLSVSEILLLAMFVFIIVFNIIQ